MVDLEHDREDRGRKLSCPLLVLSGNRGFAHRTYDQMAVWRDYAGDVSGYPLESVHFLPEEAPDAVVAALREFFQQRPGVESGP